MTYYQHSVSWRQQHSDLITYHNADMVTIAQRLKETRDAKGWSQPELARRVGIRQSFIGALESGGQSNSGFLPEIAHALGVDAYWLKTGKGKRCLGDQDVSDEGKILLAALPLISDDVRAIWLESAKKALKRNEETKNKVA